MKTIKIFENAKVISVLNGEIMIEVGSELHTYHDAALVSVCNGIVKIEIDNPLTEDILENGRIVEYKNGMRRLVLKLPNKGTVLVGENGWWAGNPLSLKDDFRIVKVYEANPFGELSVMLNGAYKLVWEE